MKRFFVLVVAVVSVFFGLATAPAYAFNQASLNELLSTNNCKDCDLSEADLTGANLVGADLERANLTRANLTGANLTGADLEKANLGIANLSQANLTGADLEKADLKGADLTGTNLTGADLEKVTMPDGSKHAWVKAIQNAHIQKWESREVESIWAIRYMQFESTLAHVETPKIDVIKK